MINHLAFVRSSLKALAVSALIAGSLCAAPFPSAAKTAADNSSIALWKAVHTGNVAAAKAALKAGGDPNWRSGPQSDQTLMNLPLIIEANERQDAPMVKLLLAHGANPNVRNSAGYPLLAALGPKAPLALVKALLDGKVDPNAAGNDQGSPLAHFCYYGRRDAVELLLAHHANLESRGYNGITPLLTAVGEGNLPFVRLLIAHGANLYQTTDDHATALHIAALRPGNVPLLRFLLKRGFEVNLKDGEGKTPLHVAVDNGCLDNVQFLLAHGADVHTRAKDGKTLITGIYDNEQNSPNLVKNAKSIVATLKAAGAKG